MFPVWISVPMTLVFSVAGWVAFSAFAHELFHLITSRVVGFKIAAYRLWSTPWGGRGFVDVVIPAETGWYCLKRGMMHLSGIVSHLVFVFLTAFALASTEGIVMKTFLLTGLAVNCYLLVMNTVPASSDGRQLMKLLNRSIIQ